MNLLLLLVSCINKRETILPEKETFFHGKSNLMIYIFQKVIYKKGNHVDHENKQTEMIDKYNP